MSDGCRTFPQVGWWMLMGRGFQPLIWIMFLCQSTVRATFDFGTNLCWRCQPVYQGFLIFNCFVILQNVMWFLLVQLQLWIIWIQYFDTRWHNRSSRGQQTTTENHGKKPKCSTVEARHEDNRHGARGAVKWCDPDSYHGSPYFVSQHVVETSAEKGDPKDPAWDFLNSFPEMSQILMFQHFHHFRIISAL